MGPHTNVPCSRDPASNVPYKMCGTDGGHLNMRLPSKPKLAASCAERVSDPRHRHAAVRIEWLAQAGSLTHPGQLALGQLARRGNAAAAPLPSGHNLPSRCAPQLPVSHRTHGGMVGAEIAAGAQRPALPRGTPPPSSASKRRSRCVVQRGAVPGAERPVAQRVALERDSRVARCSSDNGRPVVTHTSSARWMRWRIVGWMRAAACGSRRCSSRMQGRPAVALAALLIEPRPQCRRGRRQRRHAPPAAHAGRAWCRPPAAARAAARGCRAMQRSASATNRPGGIAFRGLADVDQVVRDARPQLTAGLAVPMSRPR